VEDKVRQRGLEAARATERGRSKKGSNRIAGSRKKGNREEEYNE